MKQSFIALAAVLAAGVLFPAAANASVAGVAQGYAWAAQAQIPVSSTIVATVGPIAPAFRGCSFTSGQSTNSALSMSLGSGGSLLKSGTAKDTVIATVMSTSNAMQSVSYVQNVNLLNGLITATALRAVTNTVATTTGLPFSNENGTEFLGLAINGKPLPIAPAPNTSVSIPGLGILILNELSLASNGTGITLTMIDLRVTLSNKLGLPVGTRIMVARAATSFAPTAAPVAVSAGAFSLWAQGFNNNISLTTGPWAPVGVPCTGGSRAISLAFANTPLGSLGLQADSASGSIGSTSSSAAGSASVALVKLLNGFIVANAVSASAKAALNNGVFSRSGAVSLVGAKIGNIVLNASPAPNTIVKISGLGFAILNEQEWSITSSAVHQLTTAIHIVVTTSNSLGLPLNANIIVGRTRASVVRF